jgi:filamentous hemagglutinin
VGLATVLGIPAAFALPEFLAADAVPAKTNVWEIPPTARGRTIEAALGAHLPSNFPVIDLFQPATGAATSIKSIDLGATTYQNTAALYGRLSRYIGDLAEFTGYAYTGVRILGNQIRSRTLIIAVPNAGTAPQQQVIRKIIQVGIQRGVVVKVIPFP